jgi:hypothetical protein|tara:strand:- start:150 stop:860 length:711 start_codon:yes stop_codon:yes gene_type:complete
LANLWIFGDSFSYPHCSLEKDCLTTAQDSWTELVGSKLKVDKIYNNSVPGCSNEFIQYRFSESLNYITVDDYVIVITTQQDRRWFFKDIPELGIASHTSDIEDTRLEKTQTQAVKQYYTHLDLFESNKSNLDTFVGWSNWTSFSRRINTLIIPGFEISNDILGARYEVKSNLFSISEREASSPKAWTSYMAKHNGMDPRTGHISPQNHTILAAKIVETFINRVPLDLTTEFSINIV